jgi:hypothetical protein
MNVQGVSKSSDKELELDVIMLKVEGWGADLTRFLICFQFFHIRVKVVTILAFVF